MSKFDFKTPECCSKPNVAVMDHKKSSPDDWNNPKSIVNRVCLSCNRHWYGEISDVKQFAGKEWDLKMNEVSL